MNRAFASTMGLALSVVVSGARAEGAGVRAEVESGMPILGGGVTTKVVGIRHVGEYPVWELNPFVGGRLRSGGDTYSIGLMAPLFWELDCDDSYCERFGFYNLGLRGGIRASGSGTTWTFALSSGASILLIPGLQQEFSDSVVAPYFYANVPVAPSVVGVGVALHLGFGIRLDP